MVTDAALGIIVLISMILGYRHGFFSTFIHTFGWLLAAVGAWFAMPYVTEFIADNTSFPERLSERIGNIIDSETGITLFPEILREDVGNTVYDAAEQIASTAFNVICFLLVLLAIKIILYMLVRIFEGLDDTPLGFLNSLMGMILGTVRGIIIILVLTAVLFPLISAMSPDIADILSDNLDSSKIAGFIYDNNPITNYLKG